MTDITTNKIKLSDLNKGSDIEQHDTAVMFEGFADELKMQAIFKRGELYTNFNGTQRECAGYFSESKTVITNYSVIYENRNLVVGGADQEISVRKMLTTVSAHKAHEKAEKLKTIKLTRENLHGAHVYKTKDANAKADKLVNDAQTCSPEIKQKLTNKAVGIDNKQKVVDAVIKGDITNIQAVKALDSKDGYAEVMREEKPVEDKKITKEQKEACNDSLIKQNEELKAKIKIVEDENKRLKDYVAKTVEKKSIYHGKSHKHSPYYFWFQEVQFLINDITWAVDKINQAKASNDKVFQDMKPHIARALMVLKLPTTQRVSNAEIKRAFRDEAKATHPDLGGDPELFAVVKEAYDLLKSTIQSEEI